MLKQTHLVLTLLCGALASGRADVTLPRVFSDHMVLQCDVADSIWGRADPGEKVSVSISGQTRETIADGSGKWILQLPRLASGTQGTLEVRGRNILQIHDVLAGEVWLAAGQSNMQLKVSEAAKAKEAAAGANYPQIRMFTVGHRPLDVPAEDCEGSWVVCQPGSVASFSAAAYYFARELHTARSVPVGVLHASWGATPIEAWTSPSAQAEKPELAVLLSEWNSPQRPPQHEDATPLRLSKNYPGNLFNGMIAPLIPYTLRGAIWYQGENNANSRLAALYALQLPLLIQDWRRRWGLGDFPFAWVQLPNFQGKQPFVYSPHGWPLVREAMLNALTEKNTGMVVAIDIGEATHIHPKNKTEVGHRLALWARARVYGEKIPYSGPRPKTTAFRGSQAIITFFHAEGGLVARGGPLKGFLIADASRRWLPADATIDHDRVVVSNPGVAAPCAVRYAWAGNPDCNLNNGAGLPASPFRTDHWDN